jgi:hypothetical protein
MELLAFTWVLSSWKIEQSSQALRLESFDQLYSGVFIDFQDKIRDSFCMTLSSLSFVVFVDPFQGNDGVLPSLFHYEYVVFLE